MVYNIFALEVANEAFLLEALGSTSLAAVVLRFLTSMVLSFFPGTMFAYYLLASTKVSEFVAAFTRLNRHIMSLPARLKGGLKGKTAEEKSTKKAVKQVKEKLEKTTLGDISELAALRAFCCS